MIREVSHVCPSSGGGRIFDNIPCNSHTPSVLTSHPSHYQLALKYRIWPKAFLIFRD